jgi:hypothetical protein
MIPILLRAGMEINPNGHEVKVEIVRSQAEGQYSLTDSSDLLVLVDVH